MPIHDYIKIASGLFILLNPFVLLPVFLALTTDKSKAQRRKIASVATIAIFVIMATAVFAGNHVLTFFGISVDNFRIAGGLVILLMALAMIQAKHDDTRYSNKEHAEAQDKGVNIAVVPLAIPLMAGPGAMSGAIIDAHMCPDSASKAILVAIIAAMCVVLWITMELGDKIRRALGRTGQQILTRVMGLILLALAVEFVSQGIKGAFHLAQ